MKKKVLWVTALLMKALSWSALVLSLVCVVHGNFKALIVTVLGFAGVWFFDELLR